MAGTSPSMTRYTGYIMQTPREILTDLWALAGGDLAALETVTLTGEEPQLPSSFRIAAAAQASIAAAGLAAAQIWKLRSGQSQDLAVDMRHAVVECRSERYGGQCGGGGEPVWPGQPGYRHPGADGVVGVIGPTRMDYPRVMAAVRAVSDALTEALS